MDDAQPTKNSALHLSLCSTCNKHTCMHMRCVCVCVCVLCNVVDCYVGAGCNELSLDMFMEMIEVWWCSLQVASSNGV